MNEYLDTMEYELMDGWMDIYKYTEPSNVHRHFVVSQFGRQVVMEIGGWMDGGLDCRETFRNPLCSFHSGDSNRFPHPLQTKRF